MSFIPKTTSENCQQIILYLYSGHSARRQKDSKENFYAIQLHYLQQISQWCNFLIYLKASRNCWKTIINSILIKWMAFEMFMYLTWRKKKKLFIHGINGIKRQQHSHQWNINIYIHAFSHFKIFSQWRCRWAYFREQMLVDGAGGIDWDRIKRSE